MGKSHSANDFKFNSTSPSVLDLDRLLQTIHEFKARDTGFILVVANQAAVRFSKSFPYFFQSYYIPVKVVTGHFFSSSCIDTSLLVMKNGNDKT